MSAADMIESISDLWLLALIVFLILFIVLFRKQLGGLLERFSKFQFKRGQTELSAEAYETQKSDIEKRSEPVGKNISAEKPKEVLEQAPKSESVTSRDWLKEMLKAYWIDRDMTNGEEAFNKAQQAETDNIEKLKNTAFHLWVLYDYGDITALPKLQDMTKQDGLDTSVRHLVYRYIGYCYRDANNFNKAIEALEVAVELSQTEPERATDVVQIAKCLYKLKNQPGAFKRITQEIGIIHDVKALPELYQGLASLYEEIKNHDFRAFALEKAIELEPNNQDLRFYAAYSYGEKGYHSLSFFHYKTLLQFKPDYAAALNNIGVESKSLNMPINSVKYYKKAIELNETLAMANMAYNYLNAGFEEEASQILNKARQMKEPHPNIGSAMSALSERKETESQKADNEFRVASEQQSYILDFANAYFNEKSDCPSFSGSWRTLDGLEIEIAQKEKEIEGYWTSDMHKYKITGTTVNRGATISIHKEEYKWSSSKYEFVIDRTGYAYLAPDDKKLLIMTIKENTHKFMEMVKAD